MNKKLKNYYKIKNYKKEHKELIKQSKNFMPWDYTYNFRLFVQSLKLVLITWENHALLRDVKRDPNFEPQLNALRRAVEIGNNIIKYNYNGFLITEEEQLNEFWNIMKEYFTSWWD